MLRQGGPIPPLLTSVSVADLPITDPHCMNDTCDAFAAGFAESQKIISLQSQLEYGKWTAYFYAFWILLFAMIRLYHILEDNLTRSNPYNRLRKPSWNNKMIALCRSFTYRRLSGPIRRAIGLGRTSSVFDFLSLIIRVNLKFPSV